MRVKGFWSQLVGFRFRVSGFGSQGLRFRVSDSGFGDQGFGFWVSSFGSRRFGIRVSDSGFWVSSFGFLGFRVSDFRLRNQGLRLSGFEYMAAVASVRHLTLLVLDICIYIRIEYLSMFSGFGWTRSSLTSPKGPRVPVTTQHPIYKYTSAASYPQWSGVPGIGGLSATLDHLPVLAFLKPEIRNLKHKTLNPKPENRNPETRYPKP